MSELRIQLKGEDIKKLLESQETKVSIASVIFAVGKDYMKDVDVICISLAPDVSPGIVKHYVEEATREKKSDETK